jgi:hypothetical protein
MLQAGLPLNADRYRTPIEGAIHRMDWRR